MDVIKRDGSRVPFNIEKVITAINKAFIHVDGLLYEEDTAKDIASEIAVISIKKDLHVEEIQDIIEKALMKGERPDVAKSYILYRDKRSIAREKNSRLVTTIMRRNNSVINERSNANVDEASFSGREKEASSDIQKIIALDYVLSKPVADAHKNMMIYQHDLEKAPLGVHNCLFIDFEKLFTEGFVTRNGDIRTPSSVATAMQLVAVIFQCQSQVQFGGVGSVHLDTDLVPYVKKSFYKHYRDGLIYIQRTAKEIAEEFYEKCKKENYSIDDVVFEFCYSANEYALDMTKRETYQGAEGLYHNLNTLESRAGSQVPFTSINFGRDTTPEGKLVSEALMKASLSGIGKHHLTPIFPISIFQYKSGCNANSEDENYSLKQLALESMSKRIYPNWVNGDWSLAHENPNDPDTFLASMGTCKL